MADDFGLLLEAVAVERLALLERVGIAAERVAHQRQVEAAACLGLPDMGHFVDKQALAAERLGGEIVGPQSPWGWKWMLPVGAIAAFLGWNGHHLRLTRRTARIIDRVAEHRAGKGDFAGREGTAPRIGRRLRPPSAGKPGHLPAPGAHR